MLHEGEFMTHQTQDITFRQLFLWNFMECITGRHISFSAKHSELLLGLPYLGANLELMALLKGVDPCFCLSVCWLKPISFFMSQDSTTSVLYAQGTSWWLVDPLDNMHNWRETFILNT